MENDQTPAVPNNEAIIVQKWPWLIAVKFLFDKVGLPTALVLFGLGVWTGWIPSPFLDIAAALEQHVQQTDLMLDLLRQSR